MSELTSIQKDKLMSDLKLVMADAEALLAATADDASGGIAEQFFQQTLNVRIAVVIHQRALTRGATQAVDVVAVRIAQGGGFQGVPLGVNRNVAQFGDGFAIPDNTCAG
jgi:ElaB/YqjD/DUF883 family membrane-anchored ribosome-binding protein